MIITGTERGVGTPTQLGGGHYCPGPWGKKQQLVNKNFYSFILKSEIRGYKRTFASQF